MRQVNLENFKRNASKELSNLPFEITKRGKVIAVAYPPNHIVQNTNHTVQIKKQNTNHIVQKEVSVLDSGKYDSNGKFITNFKK